MSEINDYKDNLKLSGLKITKQRTAILDILEKSEQPVSSEQIYVELCEKNFSVNLSTVYRALELMSEKGIVIKLNIRGNNKALYEINHKIHRHYLVCLGCNKIIAVNHCPLNNYEEILTEETGFLIIGHRLDVYGYCPECRKKMKN